MHLSIRLPRPYIRYYTTYCLGLCMVFIALDAVVFRTTLFDIYSLTPDGAYSQYLHLRYLIQDGTLGREVSENPILLMHTLRFAIYWPFISLQEANTGLQYALLTAIAFPVINHYLTRPSHFVFLLPLLMAYFISYRSVLAMISIGYMVIYLFDNRSLLFMFAGIVLSLLSTAVTIQVATLILFYSLFRERRILFGPVMISVTITLCIFLFVILAKKYAGFSAAQSGYQATVQSADVSVLVSIMSRSTIFVSILQGSTRGYIYILFGVLVLLLIGKAFLKPNPRSKDHKFVLLTMVPGFAAEGLGVLSITMVFLWAMLEIDLTGAVPRRR